MHSATNKLNSAFLIGVVILLGPSRGLADDDTPWRGAWITCDGAEGVNRWLCFRTTVSIDDPAEAMARIACDSKYWLWINGEPVVFEGQLKRGPTPDSTYYDRVDLSGRFRAGKNTIAVLVWHFGKHGMSHKNSGLGGLLFDATVGGQRVVSDKTWRARVHAAYFTTDAPHPNWRLPESNVAFDARQDLSGWTTPAYEDAPWESAIEVGPAGCEPWGPLAVSPLSPWKDSGLREYENADDLPSVSNGDPIVARLPYNAQVTPYLELDAEAGALVDLRTDNFRGGGEPGVRAEYVTRAGRQSYESLGWMNGHEVIYTIPAGVRIHALKYRETGFETDLAGSFRCDDEALNTLWRKAQRTLYLEMREGFVDCPGRERAQWWGDITLELQQAFYALDRRSDALSRKAIHELTAWQKPDGALFSPVPAGNWDKELPMQMLASVGRQGFWEYYRHTGDEETIRQVYPAVKKYLSLWRLKDDGLVVERKGGWTWGDWGEHKDMPLLYNAWYCLALDGQRRMAELLGEYDDVKAIDATTARLREAFHRAFWTGTEYRSPANVGPTDDRGNALAMIAGLAPPETYPDLIRVLTTQRHASPYMEKYVLEALIKMGAFDAALDRMRERYRSMIDSQITTLWEGWGIGPEGYGGGSYNHAWSGGSLTLLSQYVAGVDPLEPGYGRVSIEPRLGSLTNVEARVISPRGAIDVAASREGEGDKFRLTLTTPPNVEPVVTLAMRPSERLYIDGEIAPGATRIADDRVRIELPPGRHDLAVR